MPVPNLALADVGIGAGAAPRETLASLVEEEAEQQSPSGSKRKRSPTCTHGPDGGAATKEAEKSSPGFKTSAYECRFCLMRFEKSQALGGHMNRHRQERENEQYQQAQELLNSHAAQQQQMPRHWTLLTQQLLSSDPSAALSRTTSQCTAGGVTPYAPPISFNHGQDLALPRSPQPQTGNYAMETMISTSTVIQPELFANMFRASSATTNNNNQPNHNSSNNIESSTMTNSMQGPGPSQYDSQYSSSYPSSFFGGM